MTGFVPKCTWKRYVDLFETSIGDVRYGSGQPGWKEWGKGRLRSFETSKRDGDYDFVERSGWLGICGYAYTRRGAFRHFRTDGVNSCGKVNSGFGEGGL